MKKSYIMSYQYALLAVGRRGKYRDAYYAVPCDRHGNELPYLGDDDAFMKYGTRKVLDYYIKDKVMYCFLDVGS